MNVLNAINPIKTRVNHGGNYCGHDKNSPFLALTAPSDNRPPFLYSVGAAFRRYFIDPEIFPSLNHAFSSRQQRTERREAVVSTMLAVLEFLDLASLRVGIPTAEGFQPLKLDVLRKRTNLHPRRFERAIQTLRQAGILVVSNQHKFKNINGSYIFFPAVRRVNKAFFAVLGFGEQLLIETKAASERLAQKAQRLGVTLRKMAHFSLAAAGKKYQEWQSERQAAIQKYREKLSRDNHGIEYKELYAFFMQYGDPKTAHEKALLLSRNNPKRIKPPSFP